MDGTLYDWAEFRLSIEFANLRDIKDEWIQFKKIPFIRHFKMGYFKEPFSLENLTSLKSLTFMETALPASAFGPGRNFGISRQTAALNQRMTWTLGTFLNTDSFSDVGNSKDQIDNANGWKIRGGEEFNFTAGLNWYFNKKMRLMINYIHARVKDRETPPQVDSSYTDILQARFQIGF